jgi:hypothetical protein
VSADSPTRLDALFAAWRERCPINLALIQPNGVAVDFAIAGASEPTIA